jgi:hypothetical protein
MESITQFIGKLNKINFTSVKGETLIGDILGQSAEVTITNHLATSTDGLKYFPVQLIIRVKMNGEHVTQWGAVSNEENSQLATWFVTKEAETSSNAYKAKRKVQEVAQAIFNSL